MVVVLMGYMGSGKSFVGKELAKRLSYDFIDLDDAIERKENCKISEIFKNKGAIYFRKIESQVLKEILKTKKNTVLSLGGGTPCYADNLQRVLNNDGTMSIYLKASVNFLSLRLMNEKDLRPLIAEVKNLEEMQKFVGKHLFERSSFYSQAQISVTNENKNLESIVNEIVLKLNKRS